MYWVQNSDLSTTGGAIACTSSLLPTVFHLNTVRPNEMKDSRLFGDRAWFSKHVLCLVLIQLLVFRLAPILPIILLHERTPCQLMASHKLTRRTLMEQDDWEDWRQSEHKQLDQYETQYMFGEPCPVTKKSAVFHLIWTYSIKMEDGRKKARCTCDGSSRGGQVRVLDPVHANSLEHSGSRGFYAVAAVENLLCFGSRYIIDLPRLELKKLRKF